ncbi:MAG: methylmalonyl-CoA mutase family protein, partial [Flavobacteriales bacterium]
IARDTQLYLQNDTKLTNAIDPWGGSWYVEKLTEQLVEKAWDHIKEIEEYGGMAKAIEKGIPKLRIEDAAARKQARIDSGKETIVGVNKYISEASEDVETLEVDNTKVRNKQLEKLQALKEKRDENELKASLDRLTEIAETGNGNLLDAAVDSALKRATVGEISDAMEKVFGRYEAQTNSVSGVYSSEIDMNGTYNKARELSDRFFEYDGRRPRIMIAKMGQDGHDRGAKVIATSFADIGFDVDIGPLFQTAEEAVKQAVENDVHILGLSSLAGGHKTLVPKVTEELKKYGREDIMIVTGGVIPKKDYNTLYEMGVDSIFGPGSKIPEAAIDILDKLIKKYN